MGSIVLYSYCKSSAAFRVRISLNLKSITHRIQAVNLLPDIAENWNESYMNINPQGLVPVLKVWNIWKRHTRKPHYYPNQHYNAPVFAAWCKLLAVTFTHSTTCVYWIT